MPGLPQIVIAGSSLSFGMDADFMHAREGVLVYVLRSPGGEAVSVQGIQKQNGQYRFDLTAQDTEKLFISPSFFQLHVEYPNGKEILEQGEVSVTLDLAGNAKHPYQASLDAIDAVLSGKLENPITEAEYNGRKFKYMSVSELLRLRDHFVSALDALSGDSEIGSINMRFSHV